ncbi:putative NADH:ubiquinone reductase (H(+)-translocating) [Dioscorea sansibarensis]
MSEFSPIFPLFSDQSASFFDPLGLPFLFASNSSTYPEKLSPTNVVPIPPVMPEVVSIYDFIRFLFYLLSLIRKSPFLLLGQLPPNKIDLFGSWSMMAFLLILTIGSLYEWKRGASIGSKH